MDNKSEDRWIGIEDASIYLESIKIQLEIG